MGKSNVAFNLSISSLVIGCLGALVFVYYKYVGYPKKNMMNYGSKATIALAIILLNIAVLLVSKKNTESFTKPAIKRSSDISKRVRWADEQRYRR
tara:strand:- start:316 stop:600 length:285 start_codon:yes stop_codon:yes gene_type:complete